MLQIQLKSIIFLKRAVLERPKTGKGKGHCSLKLDV